MKALAFLGRDLLCFSTASEAAEISPGTSRASAHTFFHPVKQVPGSDTPQTFSNSLLHPTATWLSYSTTASPRWDELLKQNKLGELSLPSTSQINHTTPNP